MSKIKKLAGETAIYGFGSIVPRVLNFLLFPLHTRIFDPAAYGIISYLYIFVGFLNVVYSFGMETAYFRFATKENAQPQRVFNMAQTAVLLISASLSSIFILFAKPLAAFLDIPGRAHYIILLAIIMFIDAVVAIPFAKLRIERKPLLFSLAKIINVFILVTMNLYFFLFHFWLTTHHISFDFAEISIFIQHTAHGNGIGYVFIANLIANLFYLFFFIKIFWNWRPVFDKEVLPSMLNYAYPIMITGLAGMITEMFSRWTLVWWLPKDFYPGQSSLWALGVFSACYKYAVFMSIAIQAFRFAAEPFFFSHAQDRNSPELFARVNHIFIAACSFILLAITINMDVLKYLLGGTAYFQGLQVVPILLMGYLFLGVYYNYSVWFKLTDRTYYGTIITIGGAITTIILNFILIPIGGYLGSSWASLLCYFLMAVVCYSIGQRYYPIPYKNWHSSAYIALAWVLILVSYVIVTPNLYMNIILHIILMSTYLGVVFGLEKGIAGKASLS